MEQTAAANFRSIAAPLLEPYSDLPQGCQLRQVVDMVVKQTIHYANDHDFDPEEYYELLDRSLFFVESLQQVLNPLTDSELDESARAQYLGCLSEREQTQDPRSWIWRHHYPQMAFADGSQQERCWNINNNLVADVCSEYLEMPWLQCQTIDRFLVDAMIYGEATAFEWEIITKEAAPTFSLNFAKTLGIGLTFSKAKKTLRARAVKAATWETLLLFGVASTGFKASTVYGWWAGVAVGIILWVLISLAEYIRRLPSANALKTKSQLLLEMQTVSDLMTKHPLSPVFLRQRLTLAMDRGVEWSVGIFPILDNAIARNSIVWE